MCDLPQARIVGILVLVAEIPCTDRRTVHLFGAYVAEVVGNKEAISGCIGHLRMVLIKVCLHLYAICVVVAVGCVSGHCEFCVVCIVVRGYVVGVTAVVVFIVHDERCGVGVALVESIGGVEVRLVDNLLTVVHRVNFAGR